MKIKSYKEILDDEIIDLKRDFFENLPPRTFGDYMKEIFLGLIHSIYLLSLMSIAGYLALFLYDTSDSLIYRTLSRTNDSCFIDGSFHKTLEKVTDEWAQNIVIK